MMVILVEREAYRVTSLPDDAIKEEMMSVLYKIYGNTIPKPTGVLTSRLSHNPLYYGAFTNRPYAFDDQMMADFKKTFG